MIAKHTATGSGAIMKTVVVPVGQWLQPVAVLLHLAAAPTTSENLTIVMDAAAGAEYDTTLYSLDLSTAGTTDVFWQPDQPLFLGPGDALDVAYKNTDARVFGLTIISRGA